MPPKISNKSSASNTPGDLEAGTFLLLSSIAETGLAAAGLGTVMAIAHEIWHGANLSAEQIARLSGPHKRDALFLVERQAYYRVVPANRRNILLGAVETAGGKLNCAGNRHLEMAYRTFLPNLAPMHTRHFQDTGVVQLPSDRL